MQLIRSGLLRASQSRRIERVVRSSRAMQPLVSRFMPGETVEDVLGAVRGLRADATPTVITYLGENVGSDAEADATLAEYERLLAALAMEGADAHVSIKLTQFGWDLDPRRALERVQRLGRRAAAQGTIVAIDMEASPYVDGTIAAYRELAPSFPNTALCLQAYLHRTPQDIEGMLPLRPYIRLVKGAYRESPDVALGRRSDIDARYRELGRELLRATKHGARVAFGTHDMDLVHQIRQDAHALGVAETAFEIHMLYGIQGCARRSLACDGLRTRVLISYGSAWYPWFMRRLAEKPANLMLVARNMLRRERQLG